MGDIIDAYESSFGKRQVAAKPCGFRKAINRRTAPSGGGTQSVTPAQVYRSESGSSAMLSGKSMKRGLTKPQEYDGCHDCRGYNVVGGGHRRPRLCYQPSCNKGCKSPKDCDG